MYYNIYIMYTLYVQYMSTILQAHTYMQIVQIN